MSATQPLPADPRRQANAMLAACDYQVWQTVGAWLDLRGDDILYVEGAEDFDIVGAGEGEAVQVKASADPISLGQKATQEGLNDFWRLKQASIAVLPSGLQRLSNCNRNPHCGDMDYKRFGVRGWVTWASCRGIRSRSHPLAALWFVGGPF